MLAGTAGLAALGIIFFLFASRRTGPDRYFNIVIGLVMLAAAIANTYRILSL